MALDIDDAEQATVDAVHNEYEQEHVTEQQSIERLQDLMFVKIEMYERSDPSIGEPGRERLQYTTGRATAAGR